jgi:hypothetical protein
MIIYFAARFKIAGSAWSSALRLERGRRRDFAWIDRKIMIYVTTVPNMQMNIQR